MAPLGSLPNELLWNIVSALDIEDVINLSRTSKWLYKYIYSNQVSTAVAQAKIPFSKGFITATQTSASSTNSAQTLRKWAKKTEASATANPYSVAMVGIGQTYLYCKGSLWYMINNTLRLLETRQSPTEELVIDLYSLLGVTVFASQPRSAGTLSLLYCHEGVLSCLYKFSHQRLGGWLIAVDVEKPAILLSARVVSTKRLFTRHDRDYLYYGVYTSDEYDDRKRWVLHGYELKSGKCLGPNNFLRDLIGSEIGNEICFEVINGYFYAISNQTTYEVEEIDWTSFYHGWRFPLNNPTEKMLEKTEDEHMWRRQHMEGPLDDRWTRIALTTDESTGMLTIIESRKEWREGRSFAQRTVYKTKVIFSERPGDKLSPPFGTADVNATTHTRLSNYLAPIEMGTPSDDKQRKDALIVLTQDQLALTITASNRPHFLPSQIRLPRDVHSEPIQGPFAISKTLAMHYNLSASSFMDLVNITSHADLTLPQCLCIRVYSRRRKSPACDQDGIIPKRDPEIEGLYEEYEDGPLEMWPPASPADGHRSEAIQDLHTLMNPPSHIGSVHGTFDDTSLIYSTGQDGQPKAIMLVNFDPELHLHGLKKWHGVMNGAGHVPSQSQESKRPIPTLSPTSEGNSGEFRSKKKVKSTTQYTRSQARHASTPVKPHDRKPHTATGPSWIRWDAAMYLSIARGFDFGL